MQILTNVKEVQQLMGRMSALSNSLQRGGERVLIFSMFEEKRNISVNHVKKRVNN